MWVSFVAVVSFLFPLVEHKTCVVADRTVGISRKQINFRTREFGPFGNSSKTKMFQLFYSRSYGILSRDNSRRSGESKTSRWKEIRDFPLTRLCARNRFGDFSRRPNDDLYYRRERAGTSGKFITHARSRPSTSVCANVSLTLQSGQLYSTLKLFL